MGTILLVVVDGTAHANDIVDPGLERGWRAEVIQGDAEHQNICLYDLVGQRVAFGEHCQHGFAAILGRRESGFDPLHANQLRRGSADVAIDDFDVRFQGSPARNEVVCQSARMRAVLMSAGEAGTWAGIEVE